jgi:hypothetical protein
MRMVTRRRLHRHAFTPTVSVPLKAVKVNNRLCLLGHCRLRRCSRESLSWIKTFLMKMQEALVATVASTLKDEVNKQSPVPVTSQQRADGDWRSGQGDRRVEPRQHFENRQRAHERSQRAHGSPKNCSYCANHPIGFLR